MIGDYDLRTKMELGLTVEKQAKYGSVQEQTWEKSTFPQIGFLMEQGLGVGRLRCSEGWSSGSGGDMCIYTHVRETESLGAACVV